jgi:hypothetical protein
VGDSAITALARVRDGLLAGVGERMRAKPLLDHILDNDGLTRGLGDPEARILVEWLVERAEELAESATCESRARGEVEGLCRKARAIGRFVTLWTQPRERGGATQLAAAERFTWPLPTTADDPCELMQFILQWEARQLELSPPA